jgi:hypothetical protein
MIAWYLTMKSIGSGGSTKGSEAPDWDWRRADPMDSPVACPVPRRVSLRGPGAAVMGPDLYTGPS